MEKWNSILILNCIDIKVHNNYLKHCYFGSQCYKVIGQKCSIYREGSNLFKFNFVPSFSQEQH